MAQITYRTDKGEEITVPCTDAGIRRLATAVWADAHVGPHNDARADMMIVARRLVDAADYGADVAAGVHVGTVHHAPGGRP